jgi:uncharacterized protein YlxW (UPF0749 family)
MACICQCWKDKELKLNCSKCGGVVYYVKSMKIDVDDKAIVLAKLKAELQSKRADITCLKMEIRDLENELNDEEEEQCVLDNGAIVERVSLPNCDCSSCN